MRGKAQPQYARIEQKRLQLKMNVSAAKSAAEPIFFPLCRCSFCNINPLLAGVFPPDTLDLQCQKTKPWRFKCEPLTLKITGLPRMCFRKRYAPSPYLTSKVLTNSELQKVADISARSVLLFWAGAKFWATHLLTSALNTSRSASVLSTLLHFVMMLLGANITAFSCYSQVLLVNLCCFVAN